MSVKFSILALLSEQPRHGYDLKTEFEQRTQCSWPLNIGQVYTTLERLERDRLVQRGQSDSEGKVTYSITEAGKVALQTWFNSPVLPSAPPRDELAIKLALAVTLADINVEAIIQEQRRCLMEVLQNYSLARRHTPDTDLSGQLVLDSLIYSTEAQIRWLDHCEVAVIKAKKQYSGKYVSSKSETGSVEISLTHT